jgi:hypothetical protein
VPGGEGTPTDRHRFIIGPVERSFQIGCQICDREPIIADLSVQCGIQIGLIGEVLGLDCGAGDGYRHFQRPRRVGERQLAIENLEGD